MAYRYYPGFGLGQDAMKEGEEGVIPQGFTTNPAAYIDSTPSASDLDLAPKDDQATTFSPAPLVPLPSMTTQSQSTAPKFMSADGVMGIPWPWVAAGALVVWAIRSGRSDTKVQSNGRRRRRRGSRR